jgi:protein transport protein SEC61 subunit gamma-like protein
MEEIKVQPQPAQMQKKEEKREEKPKGPGIVEKIKNKLANYRRVIDVSRKPTKEDFISSSKITASGIVLIGIIGFIIFILYYLVVG